MTVGNGANGGSPDRDENGRFRKHNRAAAGHGSGNARRVAELRAAALGAVTPQELRAVFRQMLKAALGGDMVAARLLCQWTLGEPVACDLAAEFDELRQKLTELEQWRGS